jgi:hypothetical protein
MKEWRTKRKIEIDAGGLGSLIRKTVDSKGGEELLLLR